MENDRVIIFDKTRDEPLNNPEKLGDKDNRCWGKHRRLKKLLEKEGYKVRFRICSFKWSEQRFPKTILDIPHKDEDYHLYLEMQINDEWITLDCSNDSKLPEYNIWDGKSNCKIAVKYKEIFSPEESIKIEKAEAKQFPKSIKENKEFYNAINVFFENLRKHKTN